MSCLVRRPDNTVAFITESNLSYANYVKSMPRSSTLRSSTPRPSKEKMKFKVGKKRDIPPQELKIIITLLKDVRKKIKYNNVNNVDDIMNQIYYKKQLIKLNGKLC